MRPPATRTSLAPHSRVARRAVSRREMLGWTVAGATGLMALPARSAVARTPLKINVTFRSALYSDIFVALAKGFFEGQGLAA